MIARNRGFKLGTETVCIGSKPVVIAEIGINHGGCIEEAKKLITSAKKAGAKVVKFQSHIASAEMSLAAKQVIPVHTQDSIYQIIENCSLSVEEERIVKDFAEEMGLFFLSSPFSREAADNLNELGVEAFKIGSGEFNNLPLIDHICDFGKPLILSTGMNKMSQIKTTVELLESRDIPYALMHTTNLYPTPNSLVRLGAIRELQREFVDIPIGLSDHTCSNTASLGAVALGACLIERHYTDTMKRVGPDIVCSMDEQTCRDLLSEIDVLHVQLGGGVEPPAEEKKTAEFAFHTVVTTSAIEAGETLSPANIWVKRPGCGDFQAADYKSLLGKKVKLDLPEGHHLKKEDV